MLSPAPTIIFALTFVGEPRGKGRPRSTIITGRSGRMFVSHYTPAETRKYEAALRLAAGEAMDGRAPFDEPLAVDIMAVMPIPDSWSGRKKARALADEIKPTGKPDLDNMVKMLDALNKIVWFDDSRIVELFVGKTFGDKPRLEIKVARVAPPGLL